MPEEPIRELTPEEKRAIFDEMAAKFTADDLFGYVEGTEPLVPIDDVLEELEERIRRAGSDKREAS